jgi:DNA primase
MLAETLGVSVNSVVEELDRGTRPGREEILKPLDGRVRVGPLSDELRVLLAVAANRTYFADARNSISLDDLTDEGARSIYVALEECYRNSEASLDALLHRLGDDRLVELVVASATSGEFGELGEGSGVSAAAVIGDGIRALRVKGLRRRGGTIATRLRSLGGENTAELRELLEEKMFVDRQLQEMKVADDA